MSPAMKSAPPHRGFRARHLATGDAYERKFRDLLKQGIEVGEFAPLDVPVITAGILATARRWPLIPP